MGVFLLETEIGGAGAGKVDRMNRMDRMKCCGVGALRRCIRAPASASSFGAAREARRYIPFMVGCSTFDVNVRINALPA